MPLGPPIRFELFFFLCAIKIHRNMYNFLKRKYTLIGNSKGNGGTYPL